MAQTKSRPQPDCNAVVHRRIDAFFCCCILIYKTLDVKKTTVSLKSKETKNFWYHLKYLSTLKKVCLLITFQVID